MEKIWYILLEGTGFGPLSMLEIRCHPGVTPDTLVWREGFDQWRPMREVEELKDVFKDPEDLPPIIENPKEVVPEVKGLQEELALDWKFPPPLYLLFLLLLLTLFMYAIFR